MQQHLKDYVWMQLGNEPPVQVEVDDPKTNRWTLTEKLTAGFRQVDAPETEN